DIAPSDGPRRNSSPYTPNVLESDLCLSSLAMSVSDEIRQNRFGAVGLRQIGCRLTDNFSQRCGDPGLIGLDDLRNVRIGRDIHNRDQPAFHPAQFFSVEIHIHPSGISSAIAGLCNQGLTYPDWSKRIVIMPADDQADFRKG